MNVTKLYRFIIISSFCTTLVSCTKHTDPPLPQHDIYLAGTMNSNITGKDIAASWKNDNAIFLGPDYSRGNSIFVAGNDVYVAGYTYALDYRGMISMGNAKYWKNGDVVNLPSPPSFSGAATSNAAYSIFVSGNDVYVAGYGPTVWKNGVPVTLPNPNAGIGTAANSIFVSGTDVYAAGTDNQGLATVWKNGVPVTLTQYRAVVTALYVSGNDVYVAGQNNYRHATFWKNGVETILDPIEEGTVNAIFISGTDVYMTGNVGDYIQRGAYWKNGKQTTLNDAYSVANGIYVAGNEIFIAGGISDISTSPKKVTYWRNDVAYTLKDNGVANAIFVR